MHLTVSRSYADRRRLLYAFSGNCQPFFTFWNRVCGLHVELPPIPAMSAIREAAHPESIYRLRPSTRVHHSVANRQTVPSSLTSRPATKPSPPDYPYIPFAPVAYGHLKSGSVPGRVSFPRLIHTCTVKFTTQGCQTGPHGIQ